MVALVSPLAAAPVVWDNSDATATWSNGANWDTNVEPTAADDVTFPAGLAGSITTADTENALSLTFNDAYSLSGGTVALASGNSINVADGVTATIHSALSIAGGLSKTGSGTLVLGGSNTNAGGTVISAGKIRVANTGALGTTGIVTTVHAATTLEIAGGVTLDRPITLMDGGTVAGTGVAFNHGKITLHAAAASVTLATELPGDVFSVGNGANDVTGGSGSTVIVVGGPGTVRLGSASDFDGSWYLPAGRLELGAGSALGDRATSVTLAGGTLSARTGSSSGFGGAAENLVVTEDSKLLSDRTSIGAGLTHTLGALSMGSKTLTVEPGDNATSGTAGIVLGNVLLSGDPFFAIHNKSGATGKLAVGALNGGGQPRAISKSGAGILSVTGGATSLPAGSTFSASGGGTVEMNFAPLGSNATVPVSSAQNPFGQADLTLIDTKLRMLASGSGGNDVQVYVLPTQLTLGGSVTLDPDLLPGFGGSNKTFELGGMSLQPGTVLSMSGDSLHGIRLTTPLVLQGNAVLKGTDDVGKDGLLALAGGIDGNATSSIVIGSGTSGINLTINAGSSYGGGTTVNGGTTTLGAAQAFGTGPTTINGGILVLNANAPLSGTVTINGGSLIALGTALAGNPVDLNGGTLTWRTTTGMPFPNAGLTVSGTSTLAFQDFSPSGGLSLGLGQMNVSGATSMTLNGKTRIDNLALAGDLTLTHTGSLSVGSISEDSEPRRLIKEGSGVAELDGVGSHSGGTEVNAGKLVVRHAGALGSGLLTLGGASGTANSEVEIPGLPAFAGNLRVRSGSSGTSTLTSPGGGFTWQGNVELQKVVTLKSGSRYSLDVVTGLISGPGGISKTGGGELILANSGNNFGSGTADAVSVVFGRVTVASDGALGNPANGVTLTGVEGTLKVDGTFSSSRKLTFTGTETGVEVTGDHVFTVQSPFSGTGTFLKTGTGTMIVSPGVDNSARGSARTQVDGGILRIHGPTGLSNGGVITFNDNGRLELLSDGNTNFAHPVEFGRHALIHVDRGPGSTATGGRHTLGNASTISGSLLVTGANGYGLTLGGFTTSAFSSYLTNNAPGVLNLSSLTGNPGSSSQSMYVSGSGDIHIGGAISEGIGSGSYTLVKDGSGTLRLGTAISDFPTLFVRDGMLDLNGLSYTVSQLGLGGGEFPVGARIVTGATGRLTLAGNASFNPTGSNGPIPGSVITGNLHLASGTHNITVSDSLVAAVELTLDGMISGVAGGGLSMSGGGVLRMTGPGNTHPGLTSVSGGRLELAKTAGDAVGSGGLTITGGIVRLLGAAQIHNSAAVNLSSSNDAILDLNGFAETVGLISLTQSDDADYTAVRTGADGTLVLNGSLTLINNGNSASADGREVLITGSGSKSTPASDGILDLGGVNRTIQVTTTTSGINATKANSTIETKIINGGIVKTGPRTLQLSNPGNTFAGGLQITRGTVRSGGGTSLGLGAVTFSNAAGVVAGIDFGSQAGTLSQDFTLTGVGDVTFTYSGLAPNALTLSGNFSTTQNLIFDVVNGSTALGDSATFDLTGVIDDAAGSIGLTKIGNGTLKLDPGNTYSGSTTVQKGILSIAADSALGDSTADLVIDGGCLLNTASFALGRDLVFGANGGSVRGSSGTALDVPSLEWGAGASAFFGPGQTILSGATTGVGGDLALGIPTAFATSSSILSVGSGHVLSLRGTSALPAGNLNFTNRAVLELGNGDFTRALGTAAGEVQFATATGGGWAAHGADRAVNLGGASAPVVWGQQSPPFLYQAVSGDDYGDLILGSATGTHAVDFQNLIDLNNGTTSVFRDLIVNDGPAAVDARISGGICQAADPNTTFTVVDLECAGTLEISGPITGEIHLDKLGAGTAILSGTNSFSGDLAVYGGTMEISTDASWGAPGYVFIEAGATLDVSSMTTPISVPLNEFFGVYGTLLGDVETASSFEGNGLADGNVRVLPGSYVYPDFNGLLHVTGDFTLDATAVVDFHVDDLVPETGYNRMRVGGAVNLSGDLSVGTSAVLAEGDSFVFILNDGVDPIVGTFAGLPEGAGIPMGNGLAFQVTYLANGDGGAVGNDFGVSVVVDTFSTDLVLTVDAPLAVDFGSNFTITYTVENFGPTDSTGSTLVIPVPPNAVLVGSTPAGTVNTGTLSIPVPALAVSATTIVTVEFTAPGTEAAILVEPLLTANGIDGFLFDNQAPSVTAVMAGGCLLLSSFDVDGLNDELSLGIDTIPGVNYVLQRSTGLDVWLDYWFFEGDGEVQEFFVPMDEPKEFFRFDLVPYNGGGGGLE